MDEIERIRKEVEEEMIEEESEIEVDGEPEANEIEDDIYD